jgi:hypothetical protein
VPRRRPLALGFTLACVVGLAAASATGVAATRASGRRTLGAGLSIVVPARWHVALRLTGLAEPFERFTLASFPLHAPPRQAAACGPTQAVASMPSDGALAFVIEYPTTRGRYPATGGFSSRDFPPQPKRFVLPSESSLPYECFGAGWVLRFRAAGRSFQVMIALGRRAGANRGQLLRALSALHVDALDRSG